MPETGSLVSAENAKLGAAELKDSVVGIADNAFFQCGTLTSLKNLSKCAYIGTAAFYECTALETVSPNPRLETVEAYTFYKCKSLFRVSIPTMLRVRRQIGILRLFQSRRWTFPNLPCLPLSETLLSTAVPIRKRLHSAKIRPDLADIPSKTARR